MGLESPDSHNNKLSILGEVKLSGRLTKSKQTVKKMKDIQANMILQVEDGKYIDKNSKDMSYGISSSAMVSPQGVGLKNEEKS